MPLEARDKALVRLFTAACNHAWQLLPDLGRACYQAGCTVEELRGCVRHLVVVAGYGPCLAATNHLHAAKLLVSDTPGKIGGKPGNAFELVYASTTELVRQKMHAVDPTLCEWIRLHLYGDVYTSPGLSLAQKQMLMVAFLAEADMHEQLFGHLLAALRFGQDKEACLKAIDIGFELAARPNNSIYKGALRTLQMAYHKFKKEFGKNNAHSSPAISVPDADSVRVPDLVLSNEFDEFSLGSSMGASLGMTSLPSFGSLMDDLPRTASEAEILLHEPDPGTGKRPMVEGL